MNSHQRLDLRQEKVLVVDDEEGIRSLVCRMLRDSGLHPTEADSGEEALQVLREVSPDLLIMDLNMPDMSGKELCEIIRSTPKATFLPILLMSGTDTEDALIAGLAAGANDFVGKPFNKRLLLAKVEALLRTRKDLAKSECAVPIELGRRRSKVAVAFVDLRGFTAFSEDFDLDRVTQVLDEYYKEVGLEARHWGGTIGALSGDGILIFFNQTNTNVTHTEAAIQFALGARKRLESLLQRWNSQGYDLGFGVGIAEGEAQVGQIGFEDHQDYTVVGRVSNLAARLSSQAKGNQILVSTCSIDNLKGRLIREALGSVQLKGFKRGLDVCNILSLQAEAQT